MQGTLPQSNSCMFSVHTLYILAWTQYIVHTLGIAMLPLAMPQAHSPSHWQTPPVFPICPSTNQEHLQRILYIHGIAQCCLGSTYYAIVQYHLVLSYHCKYHHLESWGVVRTRYNPVRTALYPGIVLYRLVLLRLIMYFLPQVRTRYVRTFYPKYVPSTYFSN